MICAGSSYSHKNTYWFLIGEMANSMDFVQEDFKHFNLRRECRNRLEHMLEGKEDDK